MITLVALTRHELHSVARFERIQQRAIFVETSMRLPLTQPEGKALGAFYLSESPGKWRNWQTRWI